jgi:hypothetical protein
MPNRSIRALAAAGATVAALALPASALASAPMHLSDLTQKPLSQPKQFQISNTAAMEGMHWRHWNAPTATATGKLAINTCTPNCAQGRTRTYRATFQVRGTQLQKGIAYYKQYRVTGKNLPANVKRDFGRWQTVHLSPNLPTPSDVD